MVVIARIQSYGAVFGGADVLQDKSHTLRRNRNTGETEDGMGWLKDRSKREEQKLDLYIYQPRLLRSFFSTGSIVSCRAMNKQTARARSGIHEIAFSKTIAKALVLQRA
jgi:hypothetical protein